MAEADDIGAEMSEGGNEEFEVASQWQLIFRRFRRHRIATLSALVLLFFYLIAAFAPFVTPHNPHERVSDPFIPPQWPQFFAEDGFHLWPVVHGLEQELDPYTFERTYTKTSETYPVKLFVKGFSYKLFGVFKTNIHLFGAKGEGNVFLAGTDKLGRGVFSRVVYGTRISLSIGLIGVIISLVLGIIIGGIGGYFGGAIDMFIQRVIETLRSFPTIPLWMGLAAAIPSEWSQVKMYLSITVVLSLIGWTGMARVVRGKFLSLRDEDFVVESRLCGHNTGWIIRKHLLPSFYSHIIASVTLAIPNMILGETALSFLGIGLRPPVVSWGVLLQAAQNVNAVMNAPWLFTPGVAVILAVLAFNFVGDGIRDAADPYSN